MASAAAAASVDGDEEQHQREDADNRPERRRKKPESKRTSLRHYWATSIAGHELRPQLRPRSFATSSALPTGAAATLGAAIMRARREDIHLEGTASSLGLNRHLLAEGERILALLRSADRDHPDEAA